MDTEGPVQLLWAKSCRQTAATSSSSSSLQRRRKHQQDCSRTKTDASISGQEPMQSQKED